MYLKISNLSFNLKVKVTHSCLLGFSPVSEMLWNIQNKSRNALKLKTNFYLCQPRIEAGTVRSRPRRPLAFSCMMSLSVYAEDNKYL